MQLSIKAQQQITQYIEYLVQWNQNINLISASTVDNIQSRHIQDALQLLQYYPAQRSSIFIADLGSGAGIPGLVLAIADPNNHYILIEANSKKVAFLHFVKTQLQLNKLEIIHQRIENYHHHQPFDIVIARALSDLSSLITYALQLKLRPKVNMLFLKGQNWQYEVQQAKIQYPQFNYQFYDSITSCNSKIIQVTTT